MHVFIMPAKMTRIAAPVTTVKLCIRCASYQADQMRLPRTSFRTLCFGECAIMALQVLRELRQETATMRGSGMQISPEQGQFMAQLVKLLNVKKYLEVGVFTGYSSLAVALALPPDGKVIGLDSDEKSMATARKYWEKAGVQDRVDAKVGKAEDTLAEVMQQHGPQSLDMAFIGTPTPA